jgi:hypothetical protein
MKRTMVTWIGDGRDSNKRRVVEEEAAAATQCGPSEVVMMAEIEPFLAKKMPRRHAPAGCFSPHIGGTEMYGASR